MSQPLRAWGSCSLCRRLHVLVSLHHAPIPPLRPAAMPMMSITSSGNERRLAMLLTSSVRYNEEVPHPSGRRQYDRETQLPS